MEYLVAGELLFKDGELLHLVDGELLVTDDGDM